MGSEQRDVLAGSGTLNGLETHQRFEAVFFGFLTLLATPYSLRPTAVRSSPSAFALQRPTCIATQITISGTVLNR
jgi:hypothetical protein